MSADPARSTLAPWAASAVASLALLWLFWPGYLSWDSAYQWWLVRNGGFDPLLPVSMTALWRLTEAILPGPGGLFVLQSTAFWIGLALLARALPWTRTGQTVVVLVIGLWPAVFALLPHLWKDIGFATALLWAVAALASDRFRPDRRLRLLAVFALLIAAGLRLNAVTALPPLLAWIIWREFRVSGWHTGRWHWRSILLAIPASLLLAGLAHWPQRIANPDRQPLWPTVALWDIAAVSLAENRMLLPPAWIDGDLSLDRLGTAFRHDSNTSIFETERIRLNLHHSLTEADLDALRQVWWSLPIEHADGYWRHRLRVAELLFGIDRDGRSIRLVLQPGWLDYRDNPPIAPPERPARTWLQGWLDDLASGPMFAGWPYLLGCLAVVWVAIRRARGGLPAAVALSGLSLALPLLVIAPSAEFRFLLWPVLAALISVFLTWAEPSPATRRRPAPPARPTPFMARVEAPAQTSAQTSVHVPAQRLVQGPVQAAESSTRTID